MRIQDSLYYQDYSYVIKVGRSISQWRDAFKKTMHTAGFYFTGQVDIESRITVTAGGPVQGVTSGSEEQPFLSIVNTLFQTVFGRRLGTSTDGTTLRTTPKVGVNPDAGDAFADPFTANTRDLTLSESLDINYLSRPRNIITDGSGTEHNVKSGYAYGGPRYSSLNKYANTMFGTSNAGSYANTFQNLSALKITGTKTALDGTNAIFLLTSNAIGRTLKMNYAFPTTTAISQDLFSNTLTKFDSDTLTFDDSTP